MHEASCEEEATKICGVKKKKVVTLKDKTESLGSEIKEAVAATTGSDKYNGGVEDYDDVEGYGGGRNNGVDEDNSDGDRQSSSPFADLTYEYDYDRVVVYISGVIAQTGQGGIA